MTTTREEIERIVTDTVASHARACGSGEFMLPKDVANYIARGVVDCLWSRISAAEDALRYREVVALADSLASELYCRFRSPLPDQTAQDCRRLAEMARAALAPKEENRG